MNLSLRQRLLLSFAAVVLFFALVSSTLGIRLIQQSLPQLQTALEVDLSAGREIYRRHLSQVNRIMRKFGSEPAIRRALQEGDGDGLRVAFAQLLEREDLDFLNLSDTEGGLVVRGANPSQGEQSEAARQMVFSVLRSKEETAGTLVLSPQDLQLEGLEDRARIKVISTSYSPQNDGKDDESGLVMAAAVPVVSEEGKVLGVLCGGQLLNGRNDIVDRIRENLYRQEKYKGNDVAVVAVFLGPKRISTSATLPSGERALGTLVSGDVYNRVFTEGKRWIERAFVINDWYLTAYEPLKNPQGKIIGMLGLGLLERKFEDTRYKAMSLFLIVTVCTLLLAGSLSYILSRSIMNPINSLIRTTEAIAHGDVSKRSELEKRSPPEIAAMSDSFNSMLSAIQERDRRLRQQAQEKLARSDRLAMVGQLAAGVAHEMNNPLGSILLFARILLQQTPPDGTMRDNLERIEKETRRCHTIVQGLLDFARKREPKMEQVDVNQLFDSTLKLFENQFTFHNIQIVRDYASDLPMIRADQAQLQQVFVNMILNAADAMGGKGCLTIQTKNQAAGDSIEIKISDTGCGISPDNLERIFDPFFTTKEVGHGTGLGLSVSFGIVQSHGGELSVESKVGEGTTFTITLPQ